jgi:uncharacterized membrane protein
MRCVRTIAIAAAIFLTIILPHQVRAQEPAPQPVQERAALSVWTYALYKTITYEIAANLADIPLYYTVLGGAGAAGASLFTAVNIVTAMGAYYVHEVAWNLYGPPMQESPETALNVGLEKVLLYRVVSTARNIALVYVFTGNPSMVLSFAIISNIVDAALYAANEYAWYTWGPPVQLPDGPVLPRLMSARSRALD